MQLPCSLKTDFRLPQELFECIVPVAFKVFSSLDFMLSSYEKKKKKLFYLQLEVNFSFLWLFFLPLKYSLTSG